VLDDRFRFDLFPLDTVRMRSFRPFSQVSVMGVHEMVMKRP